MLREARVDALTVLLYTPMVQCSLIRGPTPGARRRGVVGTAAAEGAVQLGRITGWSGIPPISSTWTVVVGIFPLEIWAFAGEIKFKNFIPRNTRNWVR